MVLRVLMIVFCGMLFSAGCSQREESVRMESNSTCSLSRDQLEKRKSALVEKLKPGVRRVVEHDDGFALEFPGDGKWDHVLTDFVLFERGCCGSIGYELTFPADRGPAWLRLRADAEGKQFLGQMLADIGLVVGKTN